MAFDECMKDALRLWPKYWRELTRIQKTILYSIAAEHPLKDFKETRKVISFLRDACLIYNDEKQEQLQLFSEEFRNFILEQKDDQLNLPVNVNDRLWKKYDVVAIVGYTEHSQVVKAKDSLGRDFAIKLPCVNQEVTDQQIQHFHNLLEREAQLLVLLDNLEHPYISKVHENNYEPLGMVMHWIEGTPLDKVMRKMRPLPLKEVLTIGLQLADILRFVHKQGVIHRDIKPNNIILAPPDPQSTKPYGHVFLIDFDIARSAIHELLVGSAFGSRQFIGTPEYSAPEQLMIGSRITASTDLFSLGLVLYELATPPGKQAFAPYGADLQSHGGQLPALERCDIPDQLYTILCKLLQQLPKQRMEDADTLYQHLNVYLTSLEGNN